MRYLPTLAVISLLIVPSVARAQQISPNPNPAGNTITVDTMHWYNWGDEHDRFSNFGIININPWCKLKNETDLTNWATLTNESTGVINNHGEFENTAFFPGSFAAVHNYGTLTNFALGTLANYGTLTNKSGGTLINDGRLINGGEFFISSTLNNDGTLNNKGTLFNNDTLNNDGTLTNNGTIDNMMYGSFTSNGRIDGDGKIIGNLNDYGVTSPGEGEGAGVMTIDGDYFKVAGSKEIKLAGLYDYGRIDVTGNVELAGTLDVKLIDGFELHRGNWFDFLTVGGTLTGQYDGLGEGDLVGNFGGQDLFITYGGTDNGGGVALFTNAVPEPTTVLIWSMLAGLGTTVRRRR